MIFSALKDSARINSEVIVMITKGFKYPGLIEYFERISEIPRPTFSEERIAEYICGFAKERGLFCVKDSFNNVFVRLPASKGREGEEAILLQGHTDMVCEKNAGVEHDFLNDGIKLYENDGYIRARGTTLGADNGVAVAVMLYILDGAEGNLTSHPTVECLFTASEEIGLTGASNFDYSIVTATKMINMDSADDSVIIVGCAGGQRSELTRKLSCDECDKPLARITVKGLFGGHSGEDIGKGRANANKLMGRVLNSLLQSCDIRLVSLLGGSKDNAIPRECEAVIACDELSGIKEICDSLAGEIASELVADDKLFELCVEPCELDGTLMLTREETQKIIFFASTVPDGVFKMNEELCSIVEFSRNFGIVDVDAKARRASLVFMARSPKESQIKASNQQLSAYAQMLGMEHRLSNCYSGWDGNSASPLCRHYSDTYRKLFGKECSVTVIHAGLECAIIKQRCPDIDIISCGAIVLDLHSPDEALNIDSFERFFTVIKEMLED